MNLLFLVSMIVSILFGLGFLFTPAMLMGQMGLTIDQVGATLARQFGGTLLSLAILMFLARRAASLDFKHGTVITMFCYYLITGLVLLVAQFTVQMVPMIWGVIVLHLIFIVWFGLFLGKKS